MAPYRSLAYALAGAAVLVMAVALFLTVAPPAPDCSGGGGVRCEREAYDVLQVWIVLLGLLSVVFLIAAVGFYLAHLRLPPSASPSPVAAEAPSVPAVVSFQRAPPAPSGPKAVSFQRAGDAKPMEPRPFVRKPPVK